MPASNPSANHHDPHQYQYPSKIKNSMKEIDCICSKKPALCAHGHAPLPTLTQSDGQRPFYHPNRNPSARKTVDESRGKP